VGEVPTSCCLVERFFLLFPCFARDRLLSGHQEIEEGDVTHFHRIPVNQSRSFFGFFFFEKQNKIIKRNKGKLLS